MRETKTKMDNLQNEILAFNGLVKKTYHEAKKEHSNLYRFALQISKKEALEMIESLEDILEKIDSGNNMNPIHPPKPIIKQDGGSVNENRVGKTVNISNSNQSGGFLSKIGHNILSKFWGQPKLSETTTRSYLDGQVAPAVVPPTQTPRVIFVNAPTLLPGRLMNMADQADGGEEIGEPELKENSMDVEDSDEDIEDGGLRKKLREGEVGGKDGEEVQHKRIPRKRYGKFGEPEVDNKGELFSDNSESGESNGGHGDADEEEVDGMENGKGSGESSGNAGMRDGAEGKGEDTKEVDVGREEAAEEKLKELGKGTVNKILRKIPASYRGYARKMPASERWKYFKNIAAKNHMVI